VGERQVIGRQRERRAGYRGERGLGHHHRDRGRRRRIGGRHRRAVPAASVTIAPSTLTVTIAQTGSLAATVRDANGNVLAGRTVSWTSNNPLVATVSQSGVVTGLLPGSATITATSGTASGTAT
jgi:uncharacterized protein YjdB